MKALVAAIRGVAVAPLEDANWFRAGRISIAMLILILWGASASIGLTIGVVFSHVLAIALASPFVAFLSAAVLLDRGFGLVNVGLTTVGSLAALQGLYFVGAVMRYLTMDDQQDRG